jgi:DNA repair protein SbcD/Mre11
MNFRFLHCADIHLGKGAHINSERYADYFRSFAAMVDYAIEQKVDAVLIVGDFFDEQEPSAETILRAMQGLRPLRENAISVYAIEGNHDKKKRSEPSCALDILAAEGYLHLLRPEIKDQQISLLEYKPGSGGALISPVEGLSIAGLGFIGHNPEVFLEQAVQQLPEGNRAIVMYHTMVVQSESRLEYGYCLYDDIKELQKHVGYLALGHRHTRLGVNGEFDGWIFNPGSLEYVNPLDYRLPSELRGFFDVIVSDDSFNATHIESLKRPAVTVAVDISNCRTPQALQDAVLFEVDAAVSTPLIDQSAIIIVRLKGSFGIARHNIPRVQIISELKERFKAIHADLIDEDLLRDGTEEHVLIDPDALGELGDKARSLMVEIMQGQGIAVGEEQDFSDSLLDWKDRLASSAATPNDELLEEMRQALTQFTQREAK